MGPPASSRFGRAAVRRAFARSGEGAPEFAQVTLAAREALLGRLDDVRITPDRILDLGAGTGAAGRALARRFRKADVVSVDPVVSLLRRARSRAPRWFSRHRHVAAEAERLPLPSRSMDLIVSCLAIPWFVSVADALAECRRTLRPGGLLLLSTFGPDTLKELASVWPDRDDPRRTPPFADMHVLGDALVHTGFADVVMDVQRDQWPVSDFRRLCRILNHSGGFGAHPPRRRGLSSATSFRAAAARYESLRRPDGALPVSVELVFGHAWAPERPERPSASVLPRVDWSSGSGCR